MTEKTRVIQALETKIAQLEARLSDQRTGEGLSRSFFDYQVLFENAFDLIFVLDAEQNYVDANRRVTEVLGYSHAEIITKGVFDLIPPDQIKRSQQEFLTLKERGQYENFRGSILTKDGRSLQFEINSSAIYDPAGNFLGSIDICRDLTERLGLESEIKKHLETIVAERTAELEKTNKLLIEKIKQRQVAEEAWQASEDKLRRIINNMRKDYFLYSRDLTGNYVYLSPSVKDVLGYLPEEFMGHFTEYQTASPLNDKAVQAIQHCLGGQHHDSFEYEIFDKAGEVHLLELNEVPLFDNLGEVVGSEGIAHDISKRKKMELEVLKIQKLESTGLLAGGIAHDFNNMLSAILGNISLAKIYADSDSKVYQKLEETEKASWRARDLTQQLLTFSKGGAPVTKSESIEQMVRDSAWFTLRGSNVKCEYEADPDLWAVEVDVGQICQVIQNIAHNADQCMPNGGRLTIRAENFTMNDQSLPLESGTYVKISLTDNGPGIPKRSLARIFDPYFTTKKTGSGLGLAISYSIVKNHGGLLTVDSKINQGTTFYLYLPTSQEEPEKAEEAESEILSGTGRVMIMDDDEVVRELGCEMLQHLGYDSEAAKSGEEALELYKSAFIDKKPFDVIIMDLTIPGAMGGVKTMKEILKINPEAIGVVSSGYANDEILANYAKYGFKDTLPKPYKVEGLGRLLNRLLDGA